MFEFISIYQAAVLATSREDLARRIKGLSIDAKKPGDPYYTPAAVLALHGNSERVEWLQQLGANVDDIARAYAIAKNHNKVTEYQNTHHASVDAIAEGYAIGDVTLKVEEYRGKYKASVHAIARGYAFKGTPN